MPTLFLGSRRFTYEIIRKPIIFLRLQILSSSSFRVSAPRLTPDFIINRFINSQSSWILKHSQKVPSKVKLSQLQEIEILGEKYQIEQRLSTRDSLVFFHDQRQIHLNTTSTSQTHLKDIFDKKLRALALSLINEELRKLSAQYGFRYNRVAVRNQSSRFGSCSTQGNLNFNWQIILFPQDQFRHVLLHELTHLQHHNHSKSFWHQLSVYDPNWKYNNAWLKKEGTSRLIFS